MVERCRRQNTEGRMTDEELAAELGITVEELKARDEASHLLNSPDCDEIMLALDRLGWCVRIKSPETPEEATRKWPLNGPTDYCPDWCDPCDVSSKPKPTLVWSSDATKEE
jgi:hypothetical protein